MGIKSTRTLTRAEAEELYRDVKDQIRALKGKGPKFRMTDSQLGDELDRITDELADLQDRTNFDNYLVVS